MPILVACPTCNGQLRVADDLIGRKVRCPACQAIFDAREQAPAPPPAPMDAPVETVPVDAWRSLNLELGPEPPAAADRAKPVGAVEIRMDPGEERPTAPPGPPPAETSEPEQPRRAQLNDVHDDLRDCPRCGKHVYRGARRCGACGLFFGDEDVDWRPRYDDTDRRMPRRDCEPDRGGTVLTLGIISLVCAALFCFAVPIPLGLILGVIAWLMGSADLRKMRAGDMNPAGHSSTQAGFICGIVGTCLNALILLGCGSALGLKLYEDYQLQQRRQQDQRKFNAPPPAPKVPDDGEK